MLTYFGLVVMRHTDTTNRDPPRRCAERYSGALRHALRGPSNHTGCWPGTQKRNARTAGGHRLWRRTTAHRPIRTEESMADKPYDRLDGVIWYDGQLVPWSDATLHVCSHGLHYASAVFEGERAYGGEIFKCTEHSERLKRSAETLDFEIPYSVAQID